MKKFLIYLFVAAFYILPIAIIYTLIQYEEYIWDTSGILLMIVLTIVSFTIGRLIKFVNKL